MILVRIHVDPRMQLPCRVPAMSALAMSALAMVQAARRRGGLAA